MANAQEAVARVADYLADRLSLEGLEDWSASYVHSIHQIGDDGAQHIARLIRSILNTYEDDGADTALRLELAEAIRPFASSGENRFGNPVSYSVAESNATSEFTVAA